MVDGTHPMMFDCLTIGDDMLLWILMVYPSWMVRTLGNSVGEISHAIDTYLSLLEGWEG